MIVHIATKAAWQTAVQIGEYRADSLVSEGFIHCSTVGQVVGVADVLFRDHHDLLLLCIDETAVSVSIVYEDCYESGQQFPHIYGPLPLAAVMRVIPFPPRADGTFKLPAVLSS